MSATTKPEERGTNRYEGGFYPSRLGITLLKAKLTKRQADVYEYCLVQAVRKPDSPNFGRVRTDGRPITQGRMARDLGIDDGSVSKAMAGLRGVGLINVIDGEFEVVNYRGLLQGTLAPSLGEGGKVAFAEVEVTEGTEDERSPEKDQLGEKPTPEKSQPTPERNQLDLAKNQRTPEKNQLNLANNQVRSRVDVRDVETSSNESKRLSPPTPSPAVGVRGRDEGEDENGNGERHFHGPKGHDHGNDLSMNVEGKAGLCRLDTVPEDDGHEYLRLRGADPMIVAMARNLEYHASSMRDRLSEMALAELSAKIRIRHRHKFGAPPTPPKNAKLSDEERHAICWYAECGHAARRALSDPRSVALSILLWNPVTRPDELIAGLSLAWPDFAQGIIEQAVEDAKEDFVREGWLLTEGIAGQAWRSRHAQNTPTMDEAADTLAEIERRLHDDLPGTTIAPMMDYAIHHVSRMHGIGRLPEIRALLETAYGSIATA